MTLELLTAFMLGLIVGILLSCLIMMSVNK